MSMLRNVLSNLFSRPATRNYPVEKRPVVEDLRGHIEFDMSLCIFCGACQRRCPAAAIVVSKADKTLRFEPFRCIMCEWCVEGCPKKCIYTKNSYRSPATSKPVELLRPPEEPAETIAASGAAQPAAE